MGKVIFAFLFLVLGLYSAPGDIDISFGTSGFSDNFQDPNYQYTTYKDFAVQSDGKIVAVGKTYYTTQSNWNLLVSRFNPNGSVDTTFGTNGHIVDDFGSSKVQEFFSLQIDPMGNIYAFGNTNLDTTQDILLAKYDSSGTPVKAFNGSGYSTVTVGVQTHNAPSVSCDKLKCAK
ncbi:MAG: delta-60 repeat domain-containing protein [Campylobacterales bacterium]|nr:delta-60 repeat domain-containing protein [Campylobacterales bacterium]